MSVLLHIKLKANKVINGGVWFAGAEMFVTNEYARQLVQADEAELIEDVSIESADHVVEDDE